MNETVVWFEKEQLDGAAFNEEFPEEFFIDLIFAPSETAGEPTGENFDGTREEDDNDMWNSIVAQISKTTPGNLDLSPDPHQPKKKKLRKKKKRRQ